MKATALLVAGLANLAPYRPVRVPEIENLELRRSESRTRLIDEYHHVVVPSPQPVVPRRQRTTSKAQ